MYVFQCALVLLLVYFEFITHLHAADTCKPLLERNEWLDIRKGGPTYLWNNQTVMYTYTGDAGWTWAGPVSMRRVGVAWEHISSLRFALACDDYSLSNAYSVTVSLYGSNDSLISLNLYDGTSQSTRYFHVNVGTSDDHARQVIADLDRASSNQFLLEFDEPDNRVNITIANSDGDVLHVRSAALPLLGESLERVAISFARWRTFPCPECTLFDMCLTTSHEILSLNDTVSVDNMELVHDVVGGVVPAFNGVSDGTSVDIGSMSLSNGDRSWTGVYFVKPLKFDPFLESAWLNTSFVWGDQPDPCAISYMVAELRFESNHQLQFGSRDAHCHLDMYFYGGISWVPADFIMEWPDLTARDSVSAPGSLLFSFHFINQSMRIYMDRFSGEMEYELPEELGAVAFLIVRVFMYRYTGNGFTPRKMHNLAFHTYESVPTTADFSSSSELVTSSPPIAESSSELSTSSLPLSVSEAQWSSTSPTSVSDDSSASTGSFEGASDSMVPTLVGLVLSVAFFIVLGLVIVVLMRRRRKSRRQHGHNGAGDADLQSVNADTAAMPTQRRAQSKHKVARRTPPRSPRSPRAGGRAATANRRSKRASARSSKRSSMRIAPIRTTSRAALHTGGDKGQYGQMPQGAPLAYLETSLTAAQATNAPYGVAPVQGQPLSYCETSLTAAHASDADNSAQDYRTLPLVRESRVNDTGVGISTAELGGRVGCADGDYRTLPLGRESQQVGTVELLGGSSVPTLSAQGDSGGVSGGGAQYDDVRKVDSAKTVVAYGDCELVGEEKKRD